MAREQRFCKSRQEIRSRIKFKTHHLSVFLDSDLLSPCHITYYGCKLDSDCKLQIVDYLIRLIDQQFTIRKQNIDMDLKDLDLETLINDTYLEFNEDRIS